ncbi:hypothetical protein [Mariniflexile sp.]|uniref:hypothetical protein n=1 Tax=Mariniflexile sp. TaxID=1979402 RepID=UPI004047C508
MKATKISSIFILALANFAFTSSKIWHRMFFSTPRGRLGHFLDLELPLAHCFLIKNQKSNEIKPPIK